MFPFTEKGSSPNNDRLLIKKWHLKVIASRASQREENDSPELVSGE